MEGTNVNTRPDLSVLVRRLLAEDLGRGDVTSEATVDGAARASGRFVARETLVVSGLKVARAVFVEASGEEVHFVAQAEEGESVNAGTVLAEVEGPARAILAAERVALNILMRMCGIAVLTRRYVEAVEGTGRPSPIPVRPRRD